MGEMVKAGLLLPLDSYLAKYNWGSVFSTSVASRNSFTLTAIPSGRATFTA